MPPTDPDALPGEHERSLLRDSVRALLAEHWPAERAVDAARDPQALRGVWSVLARQGLTALGRIREEGGLREIALVAEELGRAACPAPVSDAALIHLLPATATLAGGALQAGLQGGSILPCVVFTAPDTDEETGSLTLHADSADGVLTFVEGAATATHVLACLPGQALAVMFETSDPGVRCTPVRALGADGLCRLDLRGVRVERLATDAADLRALQLRSQILHVARALGAARRAFDLVVDYAQWRRQFGQPIGQFQAVQHKLADQLMTLEGVRLALEHAATQHDLGSPDWEDFAQAVCAFAGTGLRRVSLETHHVFGAVGYAEDHEAPRHFRRVHLDALRHGGAAAAREALARSWLDEGRETFAETDLGDEGNAFRLEVRTWLQQHWSAERRAAYEASDTTHREYDAAFAREIGGTGWLGLTWPRRFGGLERSPLELLAYLEEMTRARAPRAGAPIQAAAWMAFGRPEQQARYLPEILRGEVLYGMWYSEPESGSDLVSLRTRAVRDGDEWVINGQKIWTTTFYGDYMWLAARTDPAARPHAGISMFLVPTNTPGITRVPMRTLYDGEFCNTFFDDVRVPADALVGDENRGWEILVGSLGAERAYVGAVILLQVAGQFEELCAEVRKRRRGGRPLREDARVRDALGDLAARIEVGRQLALDCVRILARGEMPTWQAAITKVFAGELMEQFNETALDILGMPATLSRGSVGAPLEGRIEQKLRHALMWVISIGTNEIQRSLIAQRGLGLPRG